MTVSGKPKTLVLADLMAKHPDSELHFVEDKLGTLDKVQFGLRQCAGVCLVKISLYFLWSGHGQREAQVSLLACLCLTAHHSHTNIETGEQVLYSR